MPLRIEVLSDQSIEIMRIRENRRNQFLNYPTEERAMIVIRYLLREELHRSEKEKFIPQAVKEARKAFKILEEKAKCR